MRHLKVIGSTYYALIPMEQITKIGARSLNCTFLGYLDTSKSYCLYDEINNNFIISRYVIFLEPLETNNVDE